MIFYFSGDIKTIAIASIVCLTIFLVGSIHYIIEGFVKVVKLFVRYMKGFCKRSSKNRVGEKVGHEKNAKSKSKNKNKNVDQKDKIGDKKVGF